MDTVFMPNYYIRLSFGDVEYRVVWDISMCKMYNTRESFCKGKQPVFNK